MADQPGVFDEQPKQTPSSGDGSNPAETTQSSTDVFADQLASIKNEEGKPKYDSVEKALSGLANAQDYIPQLKGELSQKDEEVTNLKRELERMGSIDDVVSRLTAGAEQETVTEEQPPQNPGLDDEQLEAKLASLLDKRTQESVASSNQELVNSKLNELYGDRAAEIVKDKAAEYGFTPQQLGDLAKQSPKAVLKMFDQSGSSGPTPTTSGHNMSAGLKPKVSLERPEKSLLLGATSKAQKDYWAKVKADVYERHGITE